MTALSGTGVGLPALLERERELAELAAAVKAAAGGEGSLVVLVGAAGAGKSALLGAAAEIARGRGLAVRRARGSELEQELTFGVIRQLFEPLLRAASNGGRERLPPAAAAVVRRLFGDAPPERWAGDNGGFATLDGLYGLAAAIAAERPLLLAVDDLHWVDAPSLRALSYVTARVAELPVMLVLALRPGEPTATGELIDGLEADPGARRLEISSLTRAGVAQLVQASVPEASQELCQAFGQASAGNPFYLRELLRTLALPGHPPPSSAEVQQAAVTTVGDRVLRRLNALGQSAPRLAGAMSVLGTSARLHQAAAIAGQDPETAAQIARAMRRVEILAAEDPIEWIHPLVRRSIYDSLTLTTRDHLHSRAAEILSRAGAPPDLIATHLSALRPTGSTSVVTGLLTAAEDALARDAPEVAVALLHRALDEDSPEPPRSTLLLKLGQIEVTRRNPQAADLLRQVRALSKDPSERALAAQGLSESYVFDGRWEEAAEISEQALAEQADLPPELALELELGRALVCAMDPALEPSFARDRARLRSLARGDSWPARALSAALAMLFSFRGEQLDEVLALCDHALADGKLIAQRSAGAFAPGHVIAGLATVEAYDELLAFADDLEAAARAQGSVASMIIATGGRGWSAMRRGQLAAAEEILRPLVETAAEKGMLLIAVNGLWWLVDAILERPSLDDLATLTESLPLPSRFAKAAGGAWVFSVRGRVRALKGARAQAEADLRAAVDIYAGLAFGPMHLPSRSTLALVLAPEDRDEAWSLVREELDLARATGFARPIGVALRAAGLLSGGDEGIEQLQESVRVLADSPARYEHARSLVELGAALRRSGRRADSRQPLLAGMELAYHCGAERLLTRAREELLAAGARPRRIFRSGFESLTASERRIARLAAEGRSNPEIAQALHVSIKTVETHLSNVYGKLDLSGAGARRRLGELIARPGQAGSPHVDAQVSNGSLAEASGPIAAGDSSG